MKKIYRVSDNIKSILPLQKIDRDKHYRKIENLTETEIDGGLLLENTSTFEILFLEQDEVKFFNSPDFSRDITKYLIENYFLVPDDFSEEKLMRQIINLLEITSKIYNPKPIKTLTILPTSACNARCFYCFEKGAKALTMTEQTAKDVVEYLKKHGAKRLKIEWFGGEPLVNAEAIDIISSGLKENGIEFWSLLVSNGYLLDDEMVNKAKNLWNLKVAQIALDGTEEVYNKTKNYVYKNVPSPYYRVLDNIEKLLKEGIKVVTRVNMDLHNAEDLSELIDYCAERYKKYDNFSISLQEIFDITVPETRETDERENLDRRAIELEEHIEKIIPKAKPHVFSGVKTPIKCMANSDDAVLIAPDGHLGKCEQYVDRDFYGSIYSDEIDIKKITSYKNIKVPTNDCYKCKFTLYCSKLSCCGTVQKHCNQTAKNGWEKRVKRMNRDVYKQFLDVDSLNQNPQH